MEGPRRGGVVKCDANTEVGPSQSQAHLTSLSLFPQRVVCTAGLKWYPHPALIHCVKGCEVSHKEGTPQFPGNNPAVVIVIVIVIVILMLAILYHTY